MKKIFYFVSPFLLALYPVLAVAADNWSKINTFSVIIPSLVCALFVAVFLSLFLFIFRKRQAAMILTSLLTIVCFFYGDTYKFLVKNVNIFAEYGHPAVLSAWLAVFLIAGVIIIKKPSLWKAASLYLILLPLVFDAGPAFRIANILVSATHSQFARDAESHMPTQGKPLSIEKTGDSRPDIYYIILDSYGRADILQKFYGFDNSEFLNYLEQKGFYIAEKSQSNYAQTRLSLSSSLNMDYLDKVIDPEIPDEYKFSVLQKKWENNAIFKIAKEHGYTTVFFDVGMNFSKFTKADVVYRTSWYDDFLTILVNKTILFPIKIDFEIREEQAAFHRAVNRVQEVPEMEEPTITFLHILYPHLPYIFDRDGNFPSFPGAKSNYRELSWLPHSAYIDQLVYINKQMMTIIDATLEKSDEPPVIILQADHGPQFDYQEPKARIPILNAYYLPGDGKKNLYPSISPVNSFRLVFDTYLGTNFGLLEDQSWFSVYNSSAEHIGKNFDFCLAENLYYYSDEELSTWVEWAKEYLAAHDNKIAIDVDECTLAQFTLDHSGFRGLERSENFRWIGPTVGLKMPVTEADKDYLLKLQVRNTIDFQDADDFKIQLSIDGKVVDETLVAKNTKMQTVNFLISKDHLSGKKYVELKINQSLSKFVTEQGDISLRYYGIEWTPVTSDSINTPAGTDIVVGDHIQLGTGWYPLEKASTYVFRWVDNNAELLVFRSGKKNKLQLSVSAGPGLNRAPFVLHLVNASGQVVQSVNVNKKETVTFTLPLEEGTAGKYRLVVDNGGQGFAENDPRVLNFMVTEIGLIE